MTGILLDPLPRLEATLAESCVAKWLSPLEKESTRSYRSDMRQFLEWLWQRPEWSGKMPSELLIFQEQAKGRDRFILVDFMMEFIQAKGGTYSSMITQFSHLRTFFIHNRVDLPGTGTWHPKPTREPVKGNLNLDQVREIILHADPRDQAIYLTMLQGFLDLERFSRFNRKCAGALVKHLRDKGLNEAFRIDSLSGRKRNRRAYYTFIYHDALAAWQFYFEKERGWPKEGEPIAVTDEGKSPSKHTIRENFVRIALRLHIRMPPKVKGERTGVAPHEAFRDVVRSHLQTARKKGFDTLCAEFWMGHRIDPYNYNKFTELELDYVLENAKIASEYLNILSGKQESEKLASMAKENEELRGRVSKLEGQFETILKTKLAADQ